MQFYLQGADLHLTSDSVFSDYLQQLVFTSKRLANITIGT